MKKITVMFAIVFAIIGSSKAETSIIKKAFKQSVEAKIEKMQELIGFDDEQAQQLRELELNFLLEVNKAENCFLCNRKRRVEKLEQKRDAELQNILVRDRYIKYQSIENDLLNEQNRLWLK